MDFFDDGDEIFLNSNSNLDLDWTEEKTAFDQNWTLTTLDETTYGSNLNTKEATEDLNYLSCMDTASTSASTSSIHRPALMRQDTLEDVMDVIKKDSSTESSIVFNRAFLREESIDLSKFLPIVDYLRQGGDDGACGDSITAQSAVDSSTPPSFGTDLEDVQLDGVFNFYEPIDGMDDSDQIAPSSASAFFAIEDDDQSSPASSSTSVVSRPPSIVVHHRPNGDYFHESISHFPTTSTVDQRFSRSIPTASFVRKTSIASNRSATPYERPTTTTPPRGRVGRPPKLEPYERPTTTTPPRGRVGRPPKLEPTSPTSQYEFKRQRNNDSVRKCRTKKKVQSKEMEQTLRDTKNENVRLQRRLENLEDELATIKAKNEHLESQVFASKSSRRKRS